MQWYFSEAFFRIKVAVALLWHWFKVCVTFFNDMADLYLICFNLILHLLPLSVSSLLSTHFDCLFH